MPLAEYMPVAQLKQADAATEPVTEAPVYLPATQAMQTVAVTKFWKKPAPQSVQATCRPVAAENFHAGHCVQENEPVETALKPAAQLTHAAAPKPEYMPLAQLPQVFDVEPMPDRKVPWRHWMHCDCFFRFVYRPAAQLVHAEAPREE